MKEFILKGLEYFKLSINLEKFNNNRKSNYKNFNLISCEI